MTRSFDVFFDLRLNRRLSKHSPGWWFETPSCPLLRLCNDEWQPEPKHKHFDSQKKYSKITSKYQPICPCLIMLNTTQDLERGPDISVMNRPQYDTLDTLVLLTWCLPIIVKSLQLLKKSGRSGGCSRLVTWPNHQFCLEISVFIFKIHKILSFCLCGYCQIESALRKIRFLKTVYLRNLL